MPDEMYVVRLENDCFKDITRTLRCCRLLNKMKGMKPTRELHIIRRPLTGARKSLTGPTPEKDNVANPAQHCYIWRSFARDESRTHYICEPSYRIGCCRCHYIWKSSSSLELTSCGAERCSRGLET